MTGAGGHARPFPWLRFLFAFLVIVLLAAAPLLSALTADLIASANGCDLHEGFVNECVIAGADRGETLYAMFVLGWLGMMSLPVGAIALVAWLVVLVIALLAKSARKRGQPE